MHYTFVLSGQYWKNILAKKHIFVLSYIYFKKSIFFQSRTGFNTIISQRTIRYLISEDKKKSLLEFVNDILIDDNEIR
jgi:hypothetical protein